MNQDIKPTTAAPNEQHDSIKSIAIGNRSWLVFSLIVLAVVFLVGLSGYILYSGEPDSYQGSVEVTEVRISGKVPGRITRFLVEEGAMVHPGDTLVEIYSPEVLAKELQAAAGDKLVEALNQGVAGRSRTELKQMAFNAWNAAKATLSAAEKGYERAQRLYQEGVIAAQKFDEIEAKYKTAQAAEEITRNQYRLAEKGIIPTDKEAGAALVDKSKGVMAEVSAYLKEGKLTSPVEGRISDIFPHVGELVGTGAPIMNIALQGKEEVLIAVPEDELPLFPLEKEVVGRIPALGEKSVSLRVKSRRDLGVYAVKRSTKIRGGVDVRNFEVTLTPVEPVEGLEAGMSVIVERPEGVK